MELMLRVTAAPDDDSEEPLNAVLASTEMYRRTEMYQFLRVGISSTTSSIGDLCSSVRLRSRC